MEKKKEKCIADESIKIGEKKYDFSRVETEEHKEKNIKSKLFREPSE